MKEKEKREAEQRREGGRNVKCLGPHLFLFPAAAVPGRPVWPSQYFLSSRRLFNVILREGAVEQYSPEGLAECPTLPNTFPDSPMRESALRKEGWAHPVQDRTPSASASDPLLKWQTSPLSASGSPFVGMHEWRSSPSTLCL